jgi:lipid II:glycine glycyltransferase (peptidoglycan interpeptide bridge formation enzyme)
MYYKAFEHALKKECTTFNMGRSQYNSGTYQFKKSWGEVKIMEIKEYSNRQKKNIEARKTEYHSLIKLWQKLPIGLTTFIGPYVRRHFNLE